MRTLWRLGLWGISAALALAAAAWSAHSDFGAQRLVSAFLAPSAKESAPTTTQLLARSTETENETRRLAEAVRLLNSDRDRLRTRINILERNLDEVTDTIAHVRAAALSPPANSTVASAAVAAVTPALPAPPPAPPPPPVAAMAESTPDAAWTAAISRPPAAVLPSPAPWTSPSHGASGPANAADSATGSIATRTEFGIDLGGATNIQTLRTLWTSIRSKHAGLIDGLRPFVTLREGSRPGEVELRLVAGPLTNAADAARLCASLTAASRVCQPTLFDGQRLTLR
jgi:hypothetical protein